MGNNSGPRRGRGIHSPCRCWRGPAVSSHLDDVAAPLQGIQCRRDHRYEPVAAAMTIGPLHYMVITFAGDQFASEIMSELRAVRGSGVIRLIDLLFVTKSSEGIAESVEV